MPVSRCRHSDDSAPMTALPTVVFAGTPEFAAAALEALVEAGCTVPLVLTQPDRPAGRGMKLTSSAVKRVALARGIEVFQPPSLKKDLAAIERLRQTPHDVMVAAAYGLLLPRAVLDIPPLGCLNIHASLLPRWRGAAPIQRAIEAGDAVTGICIMRMEEGLDTGPVLLREEIAILPADTAATLHDRLMPLHNALFIETNPSPAKYALSLLGRCAETVRLPLVTVGDKTKAAVREAMVHAGLAN